MPTSNIDDLLLGGSNAQHPMSPEEGAQNNEPLEDEDASPTDDIHAETEEKKEQAETLDDEGDSQEDNDDSSEVDEYGNEKEPENEAIRERLARQARKHQAEIEELRAQLAQQGASREVQQAAKDFEFDPEGQGDWQQQLQQFIKHTVSSMSKEQEEAHIRREEHATQSAFESRFREGMSRFDDFKEVIASLPCEISNPMTLATRSMENPAAFLYAAAKREPKELERISKIRDPYGQMMEMGKLEERMRRNKASTKAPRPLGRTEEDAPVKSSSKKKGEPSIEDLIAKSESKRMNKMKARQGGRR